MSNSTSGESYLGENGTDLDYANHANITLKSMKNYLREQEQQNLACVDGSDSPYFDKLIF